MIAAEGASQATPARQSGRRWTIAALLVAVLWLPLAFMESRGYWQQWQDWETLESDGVRQTVALLETGDYPCWLDQCYYARYQHDGRERRQSIPEDVYQSLREADEVQIINAHDLSRIAGTRFSLPGALLRLGLMWAVGLSVLGWGLRRWAITRRHI